MEVNRRFLLRRRPLGRAAPEDFERVEQAVPVPGPGEALVRVLYLSIDPTQRIWMDSRDQYMPPVEIGAVMRGNGIGRVVSSRSAQLQAGDLVAGLFGWQDYRCVRTQEARVLRADPAVPIPALLGVCGLTGITAYIGLTEIAKPREGETMVVSAAAGAVGSVAGQLAKLHGCRAVGIAGGPQKCAWICGELGFDAAIDYKRPDWREALAAATPRGIDINFENVGGAVMEAVMARMNIGSRMALCGMISSYNDAQGMPGDFTHVLMKRIRVQGFIVSDFLPRFPQAAAQLAAWVASGRLKHRETIIEGLEHAPEALNRLFDGDNVGKLMIKVSEFHA